MTHNPPTDRSPVTTGRARDPSQGDTCHVIRSRAGSVTSRLGEHELREAAAESDSHRTAMLDGVAEVRSGVSESRCTAHGATPGTDWSQRLQAAHPERERPSTPPRQGEPSPVAGRLDEHRRSPRRTIHAPVTLDLGNAPAFLRTLCRTIDQTPDGVEVDMSSADFVAVAGWRALFDAARYARGRASFTLSGLSARHQRTAALRSPPQLPSTVPDDHRRPRHPSRERHTAGSETSTAT